MILGFRNKVKIHVEGLHLIPPPPQFTSYSFKLISSFLQGNPRDQNNGGCDYLCVNLHRCKGPRCRCKEDMNFKGDGETCKKTQIPQGECEYLSVACYDTLSFKMPFITDRARNYICAAD